MKKVLEPGIYVKKGTEDPDSAMVIEKIKGDNVYWHDTGSFNSTAQWTPTIGKITDPGFKSRLD